MCLLVKPTSVISLFFFFNDTATTEIYTLSLHDALPIYGEFLRAHVAQPHGRVALLDGVPDSVHQDRKSTRLNSSHSQISYAVFCLKKKNDANPQRTFSLKLSELKWSPCNESDPTESMQS